MQSPYPNPHQYGCPWYGAAEYFGAPNIKWCEKTVCHWISEPANTWSNLAYLLAAGVILYLAGRRDAGPNAFWLRSLCAAITVMGVFSFTYHATNNFVGQWADFIGMFLMFAVVIGRNLDVMSFRTKRIRTALVIAAFIVPSAAIPFLYHLRFPFQSLIVCFALTVFLLEFRNYSRIAKSTNRFISAAAGIFLLAFLSSLVDVSRTLCEPENLFWHGHVMWHILSAAGFIFLALHWRGQCASSLSQSVRPDPV